MTVSERADHGWTRLVTIRVSYVKFDSTLLQNDKTAKLQVIATVPRAELKQMIWTWRGSVLWDDDLWSALVMWFAHCALGMMNAIGAFGMRKLLTGILWNRRFGIQLESRIRGWKHPSLKLTQKCLVSWKDDTLEISIYHPKFQTLLCGFRNTSWDEDS